MHTLSKGVALAVEASNVPRHHVLKQAFAGAEKLESNQICKCVIKTKFKTNLNYIQINILGLQINNTSDLIMSDEIENI